MSIRKKYVSVGGKGNKKKQVFVVALSRYEIHMFFKKFYGCFIERGKRALAIKLAKEVIYGAKKISRKDPFLVFRQALNNLMPVIGSVQKKMGRKHQVSVPCLALGNRRFVILTNWFIRNQKLKTKIRRGVNRKEIAKGVVEASYERPRGLLINAKRSYYSNVLSGRHLMFSFRHRRTNLAFIRKSLYKTQFGYKSRLIENDELSYKVLEDAMGDIGFLDGKESC